MGADSRAFRASGPRWLLRVIVLAMAAVGVLHAPPYLLAGLGKTVTDQPGAFASSTYLVTVENASGGSLEIHLNLLNYPQGGDRTPYGVYSQAVLGYRSQAWSVLKNGETRSLELPLTSRVRRPIVVIAAYLPDRGFPHNDAFALIPVDLVRGGEHVPADYSTPGRITAAGQVRITPEHLVTVPPPAEAAEFSAGAPGEIVREAIARSLGAAAGS